MIYKNNGSSERETPMLRVGTVSSINEIKSTVRVYFEDRDEETSGDLKVVGLNTMSTKHYWMPDVDEQVLCLFDPWGEGDGYVIGSTYSDIDRNPGEIDQSKLKARGIWFDDRNYIYFDKEKKEFVIGHQNPVRWVDT